ncbi:metal ABC transporter solute-binding protein, Zn/Mn family [Psychromonas ossibalaenae]|uniref:metal ABC transporter solute-binding protein, Zn/Mn family n=1 Tax=Psychromonas ossibalaenae TaxID=444922 RepID=UPI00037BD077|nr:zinc ABC transporter substrate-binding protein [Psychromonas ossibalaenae]
MRKYIKIFLWLPLLLSLNAVNAAAENKLSVVASFSILGDITAQIGGDKIELTTLVGNNGDAHTYSPKPNDVKKVAAADLVVLNGLGFEGWLPRLLESSHFSGMKISASDGISSLQGACSHSKHQDHEVHHEHADEHENQHAGSHGDENNHEHEHADSHGHHHDIDPHAWHSIKNVKVYAANISRALSIIDPDNISYYQHNLAVYEQKLNTLDSKIKTMFASIPQEQRKVIVPHSAFAYFQRDYQVSFYSLQGTSTESEASAADIAAVIDQVRKNEIKAVFVENISDNRLIEQISADTDAQVGGKLFSDALSNADQGASSYLELMEHNALSLVNALK